MVKPIIKAVSLVFKNSGLVINTKRHPPQSRSSISQYQSSQFKDEAALKEISSDGDLSHEDILGDADNESTELVSDENFEPYEELAIDEDQEFPNELKVKTFHYMCELIKYRTTLTDNEDDRKKAIEIFDKFISYHLKIIRHL